MLEDYFDFLAAQGTATTLGHIRMSRVQYLLDENVDLALRAALLDRHSQVVVWRVGDPGAPSLGTIDPDILLWLEVNRFILVTNNRFLPLTA